MEKLKIKKNSPMIQIEINDGDKKLDAIEAWAESYQDYSVDDSDAEAGAVDELALIKQKGKELDEQRKELTRPLDESKRKIMELYKKPLDALSRAERAIKTALSRYHDKQERIRREQQRLIEEQRKKDEAEAKAKLEAQAEQKIEEGDIEAAKEIVQESEDLRLAAPVLSAHKTEGVSYRTVWKWEVTDFDKVPDTFKKIDDKAISAIATAQKSRASVPGVRFFWEKVVASRGRR